MPIYEFEAPWGEIIDHAMSASEVPSIGETIEIEGVPCKRIPSQVNAGNKVLAWTSQRFDDAEGAGPEDAAEVERATGAKVTSDGRIDCSTTGQRKKYWDWWRKKQSLGITKNGKPIET